MRQWAYSAGEFLWGLIRRGWAFFALMFLILVGAYSTYIESWLPQQWKDLALPAWVIWVIIVVGLLWAAIDTYHAATKNRRASTRPNLRVKIALLRVAGYGSGGAVTNNQRIIDAAAQIRKAAGNGLITIWGRRLVSRGVFPTPQEIHTQIQPRFWQESTLQVKVILRQRMDQHTVAESEQNRERQRFHSGQYVDLHVNEEQFEAWRRGHL